tara:strand:+ start:84 stop:572 length:489 start_codon:yes stop_codon:yes gene_type:complete
MSVSLTSNGLVMPATQSASSNANTLDDYEEGTYQYTITGASSGSCTPKSNYDYFSYCKVGRMCQVGGRFETQDNSASGMLLWSLPFVSANLTAESGSHAGAIFLYRTGTSDINNPTIMTSEGAATMFCYFNDTDTNTSVNFLQGSSVDTSFEGYLGIVYSTT